MFRPVMPQRRRTPSAASTPEPKPEPLLNHGAHGQLVRGLVPLLK